MLVKFYDLLEFLKEIIINRNYYFINYYATEGKSNVQIQILKEDNQTIQN